MTDAHENTPTEEYERIAFQPDYDKYGVATSEDGTVILRIDTDRHLSERVGSVGRRQTEVILNRRVVAESLTDGGDE